MNTRTHFWFRSHTRLLWLFRSRFWSSENPIHFIIITRRWQWIHSDVLYLITSGGLFTRRPYVAISVPHHNSANYSQMHALCAGYHTVTTHTVSLTAGPMVVYTTDPQSWYFYAESSNYWPEALLPPIFPTNEIFQANSTTYTDEVTQKEIWLHDKSTVTKVLKAVNFTPIRPPDTHDLRHLKHILRICFASKWALWAWWLTRGDDVHQWAKQESMNSTCTIDAEGQNDRICQNQVKKYLPSVLYKKQQWRTTRTGAMYCKATMQR